MNRPLPAHAIAIRDQLAAILRDAPEPLDLTQLHRHAPTVQRHLRRDGTGLCADDHAVLHANPAITLQHCFGPAGHVVTWKISPAELVAQLNALVAAGYVELQAPHVSDGVPSRWAWIPATETLDPRRAGEHAERLEFAAIAFAAGHTGAVR